MPLEKKIEVLLTDLHSTLSDYSTHFVESLGNDVEPDLVYPPGTELSSEQVCSGQAHPDTFLREFS